MALAVFDSGRSAVSPMLTGSFESGGSSGSRTGVPSASALTAQPVSPTMISALAPPRVGAKLDTGDTFTRGDLSRRLGMPLRSARGSSSARGMGGIGSGSGSVSCLYLSRLGLRGADSLSLTDSRMETVYDSDPDGQHGDEFTLGLTASGSIRDTLRGRHDPSNFGAFHRAGEAPGSCGVAGAVGFERAEPEGSGAPPRSWRDHVRSVPHVELGHRGPYDVNGFREEPVMERSRLEGAAFIGAYHSASDARAQDCNVPTMVAATNGVERQVSTASSNRAFAEHPPVAFDLVPAGSHVAQLDARGANCGAPSVGMGSTIRRLDSSTFGSSAESGAYVLGNCGPVVHRLSAGDATPRRLPPVEASTNGYDLAACTPRSNAGIYNSEFQGPCSTFAGHRCDADAGRGGSVVGSRNFSPEVGTASIIHGAGIPCLATHGVAESFGSSRTHSPRAGPVSYSPDPRAPRNLVGSGTPIPEASGVGAVGVRNPESRAFEGRPASVRAASPGDVPAVKYVWTPDGKVAVASAAASPRRALSPAPGSTRAASARSLLPDAVAVTLLQPVLPEGDVSSTRAWSRPSSPLLGVLSDGVDQTLRISSWPAMQMPFRVYADTTLTLRLFRCEEVGDHFVAGLRIPIGCLLSRPGFCGGTVQCWCALSKDLNASAGLSPPPPHSPGARADAVEAFEAAKHQASYDLCAKVFIAMRTVPLQELEKRQKFDVLPDPQTTRRSHYEGVGLLSPRSAVCSPISPRLQHSVLSPQPPTCQQVHTRPPPPPCVSARTPPRDLPWGSDWHDSAAAAPCNGGMWRPVPPVPCSLSAVPEPVTNSAPTCQDSIDSRQLQIRDADSTRSSAGAGDYPSDKICDKGFDILAESKLAKEEEQLRWEARVEAAVAAAIACREESLDSSEKAQALAKAEIAKERDEAARELQAHKAELEEREALLRKSFATAESRLQQEAADVEATAAAAAAKSQEFGAKCAAELDEVAAELEQTRSHELARERRQTAELATELADARSREQALERRAAYELATELADARSREQALERRVADELATQLADARSREQALELRAAAELATELADARSREQALERRAAEADAWVAEEVEAATTARELQDKAEIALSGVEESIPEVQNLMEVLERQAKAIDDSVGQLRLASDLEGPLFGSSSMQDAESASKVREGLIGSIQARLQAMEVELDRERELQQFHAQHGASLEAQFAIAIERVEERASELQERERLAQAELMEARTELQLQREAPSNQPKLEVELQQQANLVRKLQQELQAARMAESEELLAVKRFSSVRFSQSEAAAQECTETMAVPADEEEDEDTIQSPRSRPSHRPSLQSIEEPVVTEPVVAGPIPNGVSLHLQRADSSSSFEPSTIASSIGSPSRRMTFAAPGGNSAARAEARRASKVSSEEDVGESLAARVPAPHLAGFRTQQPRRSEPGSVNQASILAKSVTSDSDAIFG